MTSLPPSPAPNRFGTGPYHPEEPFVNVTAPDLADLIADPERLAELLDFYRQHLADTPLADQLVAATADAEQVMRRLPGSVRETPVAAVPDAVLVGCLDQLLSWADGRSRTCLHAPHPRRPQPILAAAWKPGLIVCMACTHLLRLPRGSAADRSCDLCGRVVAGVDDGEPIYPSAIRYAALTYLFGACPDCRTEATA